MSGTVDTTSYPRAPAAAPPQNFLQMANQVQQYQNSLVQNDAIKQGVASSKQTQAQSGFDHATQQLGGLLTLPPEQRGPAAYALIDQGVKSGRISQQVADQKRAELPPPGSDPAEFTKSIVSHLYGMQSAPQQITGSQPALSTHDTGNGMQILAGPSPLQGFVNSSQGGAPIPPQQVGATLPSNLMGQAQLSDIVTIQLPNGKNWIGPRALSGSVISTFGGAIVPNAPGATPTDATAPAATSSNPAFSTVRPGATPGPLAGGGITVAPGQAEALKTQTDASTQAGVALTGTDATRPQKQALLQDILTQANVPGAFSGPDAPAYKTLMARLGQVPGVITPDVAKATSAQDAMEKAMANFQTLQMRSMIGTNAGLAQTIAGAPHIELSKGGLQANVHQLQGTLDAESVMSNAWQKALTGGAEPGSFQQWQRQFIAPTKQGQFDPRVFWLQRMSADERKTFVTAAKDPNLAKNYQFAHEQGWVGDQ